ncbi:MAG: TROVE domain-containing protein [Gemmatimonadaceae bacterium]|nr:TROVE domain-containing protein [Gemmatimonadaceae bacterium]
MANDVERLEAIQAVRHMAVGDAARVIRVYALTRELVPAPLLAHAEVWEAMIDRMPIPALVRDLGAMGAAGLLVDGSDAARTVVARLDDGAAIRRARVHPVALLAARQAYARGHGAGASEGWVPVPQVIDALDRAFHLALANVPPTGKRILLALDVSRSMDAPVRGLSSLSCREAAAAMALVTAASEPSCRVVAFTARTVPRLRAAARGARPEAELTPLAIPRGARVDDVVRMTRELPAGGTDCALPIAEALVHGWDVDAFVVYTDTGAWAGAIHPAQLLREYRECMGIAAKLVVVAMASTGFRIADPADAGMLDVAGFDASTPHVVREFLE